MRSSEYSDEFPKKFRDWVSSEFPRNIPMKYRGRHIPRKTPTNIRGYIIAVGDFNNSEEILKKEPLPSVFCRNFLGTVGSISSINTRTPNLFSHSISSSSHILYLHMNLIEKNMSSSNYYRSWIDRPHLDPNTRLLREEYQRGITEFMGYKIWYHHGETDYEYGSTSEPAVRLEEPIRMDEDYGVVYPSGYSDGYTSSEYSDGNGFSEYSDGRSSSEYSEGISPRNIPTDTLPHNIPTAKVSRNISTAKVRQNIPIPLFSRNVSEDRSIGNIRGDTDEKS
ncbi:hypothetical protein DY000_02044967 [Brassica cretica]|uniref:Uncharacterized protein n=1 Tax=Brassica cretica TaxID=69181 RepID=A0ABQ7EWQ5_BRACR|nr:hypothetical protein DY000_02044967 [Brassica cretica]